MGFFCSFMVLAGVGTGMTFGPLAIHARFSQPQSRVAVVVALQLFVSFTFHVSLSIPLNSSLLQARSLGGTIGLAQCSTVLNSKVRHYFNNLPQSTLDSLSSSGNTDALNTLSSSTLDSVSAIDALPPDLQQVVRDAFQYGVRWSFISLIPWTGVAFLLALRLSRISAEKSVVGVDKEEDHSRSFWSQSPSQVERTRKIGRTDNWGDSDKDVVPETTG